MNTAGKPARHAQQEKLLISTLLLTGLYRATPRGDGYKDFAFLGEYKGHSCQYDLKNVTLKRKWILEVKDIVHC